MKSTPRFAFAAAFVASAVVCGIHILRQPQAVRAADEIAATARMSPSERVRLDSQPSVRSSAKHRDRFSASGQNPGTGIQPPSPGAPPLPIRKVLGTPPVGRSPVLSESQWRADAAKVELEANHELNRLVGLLELDSAQQDKVFAALARHSSHWSPGMQTAGNLRAGGPGTASESAAPELPNVSDFLSADQQQTLIQEEMERQAWWEEVLPQLLPPTLQSDPIEPTVPTVDANPPPETKAFEGDGMLLEE